MFLMLLVIVVISTHRNVCLSLQQHLSIWAVKQKKDYKGKDPMSPEQITSHEPTAVKRDPEDIKEGVAESEEKSKERLRRSGMTKGTDKA
jgi:hypothetical protein